MLLANQSLSYRSSIGSLNRFHDFLAACPVLKEGTTSTVSNSGASLSTNTTGSILHFLALLLILPSKFPTFLIYYKICFSILPYTVLPFLVHPKCCYYSHPSWSVFWLMPHTSLQDLSTGTPSSNNLNSTSRHCFQKLQVLSTYLPSSCSESSSLMMGIALKVYLSAFY